MNRIVETASVDPFENLALEELLLARCGDGVTLYLWQNQRTVVIGRSQNALKECRLELLEREGGRLARRTTGGGAVFHDLGNLNFTFIAPKALYDVGRQLRVVQRAVESFGVPAAFTGRNDLVTSAGAKFSGNAYRHTQRASMHHGTLLIRVDMERLGRYLSPAKAKILSKGVESVRSRVTNLAELNPAVTVEGIRQALRGCFIREYGPAEEPRPQDFSSAELTELTRKHASARWRLGASPPGSVALEHRFPWGMAEVILDIQGDAVVHAAVFTDAMDPDFADRAAAALTGCPARGEALESRLCALGPEEAQLGEFLRSQL